jgi:hypothetical protein
MATLDKLKANKSVLKRTKPGKGLPKLVLYVEWLAGERRRKVLDEEGAVHQIDDAAMISHYKLVTGSQGKELIEKHWAKSAES